MNAIETYLRLRIDNLRKETELIRKENERSLDILIEKKIRNQIRLVKQLNHLTTLQ